MHREKCAFYVSIDSVILMFALRLKRTMVVGWSGSFRQPFGRHVCLLGLVHCGAAIVAVTGIGIGLGLALGEGTWTGIWTSERLPYLPITVKFVVKTRGGCVET